MAVVAALWSGSPPVVGQVEVEWNNPAGGFHTDGANWNNPGSPGSSPGAADLARFDLSSPSVNNILLSGILSLDTIVVGDDQVFLGAFFWSILTIAPWICFDLESIVVGETSGDVGDLTLVAAVNGGDVAIGRVAGQAAS